jgi:phage gpG-like protein
MSDHYEDVTDRYLVWGSQTPYAAIHQFGASFVLGVTLFGREGEVLRPGTLINVPARPFVGISADDFEQLIDAVIDQTIELLKYKGTS